MTSMKTMKNAKGVKMEGGKSISKREDRYFLIDIFIYGVWVCLTSFFMAGCASAAYAPAPAATATAAPAAMPTSEALTPNTPLATAAPQTDIVSQLEQIDVLLRQQITGSIAYNKPESMALGQTATIELLLNPSLSEEQLATQVTESGTIETASIEFTPQMKAVLLSPLADAFTIQPIQEEIQLISGSATTRWSWFVTARKSGTQKLVLVIYRLVKYEGQDYWREVETYKADIVIRVPFSQWILSVDWKWTISIIVALLSLPFFWRWFNRRNKQ